jgi:hypothetical protein
MPTARPPIYIYIYIYRLIKHDSWHRRNQDPKIEFLFASALDSYNVATTAAGYAYREAYFHCSMRRINCESTSFGFLPTVLWNLSMRRLKVDTQKRKVFVRYSCTGMVHTVPYVRYSIRVYRYEYTRTVVQLFLPSHFSGAK